MELKFETVAMQTFSDLGHLILETFAFCIRPPLVLSKVFTEFFIAPNCMSKCGRSTNQGPLMACRVFDIAVPRNQLLCCWLASPQQHSIVRRFLTMVCYKLYFFLHCPSYKLQMEIKHNVSEAGSSSVFR
jgi:hypothetical protein